MKIKFVPVIICLVCLFFKVLPSRAQLTGVKTIPGDYASVSSAVTAVNAVGVGAGGVTFNVAADYTETITATISLTATGTAANPIIFQKDPATTGANPAITAYATGVGTPSTAVQDGIWRLVGSDYVMIDGIDVSDNPLNTTNPSTMEYGYALYKATTSNGCQFVTIQNCVITLNRSNNAAGAVPMTDGSAGIVVMDALPLLANVVSSATVATGSNSNNKFYSNTIQNCNIGISLIGYAAASPYTSADTNNDVGGSSPATGNTIINYGGASGATTPAAGIRTLNQYGLNVSYNSVNNNTGLGINHSNALRGILIGAAKGASSVITYNKITVKGGGTTQQLTGIENASGSTPAANSVNISNNSITNCNYTTATTGSFFGINNSGAPTTLAINNDTVSNNSSSSNSAATATGLFYEILNSGTASTVTINNNILTGNSTATSIGLFAGIYNSATVPVLNINGNTLAGDSTATVTGLRYSIYNAGAVTTTVNINSNNIGTASLPAIKFTAASANPQIFIYNYKGASTSALSISYNNFYNVLYTTTTAANNTYISNAYATRSQVINGNTFTNLNVNISGNITFISNAVAVSAIGKQDVDSNAIVGTFTKAAAGAVTIFAGSGTSASGSIININNNNFSGITLTGATSITGFVNTDAGNSRKTIQNNVFSKWVAGTGAVIVLNINLTGINNATTGNIISNIVSAGNITGISTAAGNDNIYSNTIDTLISTGGLGATVTGISVAGGTTKNIYLNTIYGLQANTITTGSVKGIYISAGATVNVFQNTINTLLANSITSGSVSGISVGGGVTVSVFRNKIYDLSSSSNLMSSAIVYGVLVSGSTASNTITIQNNLIGDLRTPFASAVDPIRGISISSAGLASTIKVYYNTIYLNGVSSGANFGSTGLYHLISGTSTTARLVLKNNIINNVSTATGTGLTVAYRRSGATLTNYDSTSNNNLFYAGTPAANKLIFSDGTAVPDQLLSNYKTRVFPRDAQSVTEDMITIPKFISTSGSSPFFLHLDSIKTTQAESGGISIAGSTTDFDGQIRQGNTGYTGTGTAPDMGADETGGNTAPALSGTYNVGIGQTYTSLTNAGGLFASINSLGLSGNVVANITSDLAEDGTNVLYQWAEKGTGNYTLAIQPDASAARLISGNVAAGMIRFNGAKRVTIDGSNGTVNSYLTFRNTNTAITTGTAFTFINGAANNTIKYCNIEAAANATNGVVLFSTSTAAGGNSNNTVSNCNINATVAAVSGNICIYSAGTAGNENATNTISNNKIFNYRDRALDVAATGSKSWNISGNSIYNGDVSGAVYAAASTLHGIRILGGSGYTISNNYIGGNGALASGTAASYSSTGILSLWGILLTTTSATPASVISGNTIANLSVSAVPTAAASANVFIGIESNGSGINIGGPGTTDGNIVGSNTINGSVSITTTTSAATYLSLIRGISCNSTGGLVTGNQVAGIDINNIGTFPAASTFNGIYVNNVAAPSQVNNNIIGSSGTGAAANSIRVLSSSTSTTTLVTGIAIGSTVASAIQVDGNLIKNISFLNSGISTVSAGGCIGISSAAAGAASVTITNNTVTQDSVANYTSGLFYGIYNSGAASTVTINNNTLTGNSSNSASGVYYAIYNTGAVTSAININGNNIGNATTSAFTFNAINSGNQILINNAAGTPASALSVSNNNFQGINYVAAGTGTLTFISNGAATLSQAINGNTFTNLNVNTAGNVTFISDNVSLPASGAQNVNNNSIVTGFTKKAGGIITLFTTAATTSAASSVINNNNNNFSNITALLTTAVAGWSNLDVGTSVKTIQNNTFSNWIGGTGSITAISVNSSGTGSSTNNNLISNISGGGAVTGIATSAGNDNIFSNTIDTLTSNFAGAVTGISISTAGATINIYKNKIYDLSNSNVSGTVYGISVGSGTSVTIYNNLIGNFRTPVSTIADAIRGISITSAIPSSAINVYFNTIYLNATSTAASFGTSGIFHTISATATTAVLNLRNNSITNTSASTSGKTVAFRRSGVGFTNYAATSNNNLFYAGAPASGKLVFFDGTTGDQTIAAYKARTGVPPADGASISEDLTAKFLSLAGSSAVFLHMSSTAPSGIESGGANIAGYTDDFDGQIRAANPGYTGTSLSPDIGADEVFGVENIPPTITYTLLTNTTSTANRSVTGINITDGSGVNVAPGTKPRIYYKRFSDANAWLDNSSSTNGWKYAEATNSVSPFTFTIDYSLLKGGATVTAGAIQYFIVAQDIATTANVAIDSGAFAATPSSVALTSAAFPITGTINSYAISYSGTYNVGTTEIFTSLTKADGLFASVNSAGLAGNTIFNITSNLTEDGANALNQWAESGVGNYTLTIKSSAATLRTISGNVAAGLIRLDGADRVTIDGSINGSGKYLSFKNTNTAGTTGTAFTFINGAANNTIRYCDAQAYADSTDGVILFGSTIAGGNSNNLIDNCTINATVASNTGNVAIYSGGTAGNENVSDTISNNSIYGYRDRGFDIAATGSSTWSISGNSFYNGNVTGTINYPASTMLHGIRILGGSGYAIQNNYIGASASLSTGANAVYSSTLGNLSYQGILLTTNSSSPASNIKGNIIAGISLSSVPTVANSNAFTGIETNGSGINVGGSLPADGNTIGSVAVNGSIVITTSTASIANTSNITGINHLSTGGVINNNHVGGFDISNIGAAPAPSFIRGIYINNAAAPTQVNNNLIGSASISNSIRVLAASTSATTSISGIVIGPVVNSAVQVNNNSIENISNLSTTSSGSFIGINNIASLSSAVINISSDTVQLISGAANSNAGSTIYGGIVSSSASTISNNLINNITLASTGPNAQITGINVSGDYANTVSDNIISNLSTASNKATANAEIGNPAGSAIIGLLNSTTAAGQIISKNRFLAFNSTSNAAVNVVVTGMIINATGSGDIFNNRFGSFTNHATGSGPAICHIMASGGTFNAYNNALLISNLTNINGIKIYGIVHASPTNWNYFHNSVRVAGSSNGVALRSAAFLLSANSSPVLKNNIFFNVRTGAGFNYAISNLSSPPVWTATASDYNDFYSINPNTVAEWGNGASETFSQWRTLSGGDSHSINDAISFILSPDDLEPDSISNCAFVKAGIPITTPILINTDINGNPRNTISPDLGAYEFNYTGFTIIAGSNSPVCAGDSIYLTVDPGKGISPHFSWTNPANVVVSTLQNPAFLLTASGQYKVTVTDSTGCSETDSTSVLINQRPTAHITSQTSLCDSGIVYLNITVTGTGIINGTLSNGDDFSGTAPLIIDTVSVSSTTAFYITDLSDSTCTSIPSDMPDTATVTVTHLGDWLGITTNWHDPVNWCGGILPTSLTDVTIPIGTPNMPIITDSVYCNSLIISIGDSLTITGAGTLNVAGIITNNGTYNDNGTTNFNGTSGQQTFSGVSVFNNLKLNNASGLQLPAAIIVKNNLTISAGILNANNFGITITGNWINNVSTTAFTAGTAIVTFNNTTAKSIGGSFATTFNNLTIASTGSIVSLNVSAGIAGDLLVSSGIFDLGAFGANRITSGGALTVANNATLRIGGTNTYPANYTTNTLVVASTVEYSGTNQIVSNRPYGNLTLSSSAAAAIKTLPATALIIAGNFTSTLGSGTSVSFTAGSNITVNGNVSIGASTTFNGGSYSHSINGNWTNFGTFTGSTSTIIFTGSGAVVSGTGTQNFNNLTVGALGISFSSNSITLTGNLATSGAGSFTQAAAGTLVMSGIGTTISGAGISLGNLTISGTVSTLISLNISGNLSVSGSFTAGTNTITMSGTAKTISGTGTIGFGQLYITGSITSNANFSISSGITVSGSLSASAGTATFTGTSTLSGTANLFNTVVNGTSLQLSSGSVLGIANVLSITSGTLDVTTTGPNTVNFNGTGAQNINAITYGNLVLSNGNTKTAIGNVTALYDIVIGTGTTFAPSSYTYTTYGNWINNGTFIPGTSTILFLGATNGFISGVTTFNILTINTDFSTTEIILNNNISVATLNMTRGFISTKSNTLTITGTRTGGGFIYGNIQRTHAFTTGVAYAFEGPDNTITFSAVSSVSSITVSVVEKPIADFPFGGSISRVYDIVVPSGTYNATLRLHYEDDELNGNNESSIALWHYNGSSWASVSKTGNSTISNYVEQSGLTDITNRWTLSDDANLVQWNGSVSSDWNTPANWTVLQGSASGPPSATDIVDLGTAAFTNQPAITTNVTVKNIIFGSVQAVALTLGSGGSLTTNGDINGDWTGNATHTINVNNQSLIINGHLDLSDGTNGHAIDLNIGSGNVTILGSLLQSGGANINFGGTGTLSIHINFEYESGIFTAGNGTVIYNGDENQHIAHVNYNTLTINKTGGFATIDSVVNIAGNLLISAGELDNFSTTTIAGDVSINPGASLANYQVLHVQGNWNNNGIYTSPGSSTFFDGGGTQNITATTFNNLIINKPVGTNAVLTGDIVLNGDLTITSGTFDIKTFNCNRSVQGGTITLANAATFIVGANNSPLNFSNGTLADSSTVIANGTGPQFIFGDTFGNLIMRNAGAKTLVAPITVNGDFTIESGSNFDAGSQTLTLNGNWINNGTFTPSTSTLVFSGAGKTVSGNTTFSTAIITGSYVNLSNITYDKLLRITSSGSISSAGGIFTTMNGDLINNGILYTLGTTTFTGNVLQTLSLINAVQTVALIVNFNGSVSPVLNSTSPPQYGYLNINNTGGVNPSVDWTILYSLTVASGASFNCGVTTQNIYGSVTNNGAITSSGILNLIPTSAATVNLGSNFTSTGRVIFGGAGAMTVAGASPLSFHNVVISSTNGIGITPSSAWSMSNNFTVNSGSIFNAGNYVDSVGGKISNSGTINSGTSTFILNGTGTQDIFSLSNFNNLTLKKVSGLTTMSSNVTVNGILNFMAGNIKTGNNVVMQPSTGTVTNAAQNTGWVNGNLQKSIATGSNVSSTFQIGDSAYYTPATVLFANVSVGGNLTASTTHADHPQIDLSGINKNLDVNRYWTLTNTGIGFTTAAATFNWVAADVDPGATTANFKTSVYNGSSWGFSQFASPLPTSIQATGLTSLGSFVVGEGPKITTWTGAAGTTDWFTAGNWFGGVPDGTVETLIPSLLQAGRFFPAINNGAATVDTVTIQTSAALVITNSTLQIKGAIINNGTIDASNGTIEMTGSSGQSLAASTFQNNAVNNLIISNSSAAGVTLAGALDLYGSLTYSGTGMKLITNDTLTLKSTALNTASVGDMTGNTITGKVTVERYISARKGWRLLSIPTNTTQTIKQAWQEGCGANSDCLPGFGTQITGAGGTAAGFDVYTATPSMKIYNPAGNMWAGVPNTNIYPVATTAGYIVFVRGDRSVITSNAAATSTILHTKGTLFIGDQLPLVVNAGNFASIGNPYASEVDMRNIEKTGMKDFFYVWDPKLGGSSGYGAYQTFSKNGGDYVVTPGLGSYGASGSVNNYIESGQAFLIQANSIGNGSLTFKESAKSSGSGQVSAVAGVPQPQLRTSLYGINTNNTTYMIDGTLINYGDGYSNSVDNMDAVKSINSSENLSIKTANTLLVIERRQSIVQQDTIFLNLANTKVQKYRFELTAIQLERQGLAGFLEDTYMHTSIPLNLNGSTIADFNIVNIPASYAPGRFRIVFKQLSTLPVTFTSVKAYQVNKNIAVEWKAENERNLEKYSVEKSIDGNHYAIAQTVAANNAAVSNYNWLDVNPSQGYNYYRILSTDVNSKTAYSTVVKVYVASVKQVISIYPNPISDGIINLQFANEPAGKYGIRLLNNMGQVMISKQIYRAEGSSTEKIQLDKYSAHGIYQVEITRPDGNTLNIEVIY